MNNRYETPAALRHDAHTLAEDARALLDATSEIADEKVAEARKRVAEALEHGKQTYVLLQDKAIQSAKAADRMVHEHPYQTMAMAFGFGAIVGCLMCRRG